MNGALCGDTHVAIEPAHQQLADLARAPVRLLALERDDLALELRRQLVCVTHRPPRAIAQRLEAALLVPIEDLVSGLARDAELTACVGHRLAFQQLRHEPQALVHHRTLLPRHTHLPQRRREGTFSRRFASGKCFGAPSGCSDRAEALSRMAITKFARKPIKSL